MPEERKDSPQVTSLEALLNQGDNLVSGLVVEATHAIQNKHSTTSEISKLYWEAKYRTLSTTAYAIEQNLKILSQRLSEIDANPYK